MNRIQGCKVVKAIAGRLVWISAGSLTRLLACAAVFLNVSRARPLQRRTDVASNLATVELQLGEEDAAGVAGREPCPASQRLHLTLVDECSHPVREACQEDFYAEKYFNKSTSV